MKGFSASWKPSKIIPVVQYILNGNIVAVTSSSAQDRPRNLLRRLSFKLKIREALVKGFLDASLISPRF